jgi:hypothetical protein
MRIVTLSADEALIDRARRRAVIEKTTLNELFREWLLRHVAQPAAPEQYIALMNQSGHVRAGSSFTWDEMGERRQAVWPIYRGHQSSRP